MAFAATILLTFLSAATQARAQPAGFTEVHLETGQTIRDLAERYLGDPDLWPEILRASDMRSVADLSAETVLRVPVDAVAAANRAIGRAVVQIRSANRAGAQLFAPDEIGRAVGLHDQALEQRVLRRWTSSKDLALASYSQAADALKLSETRRDKAAEALLSDRLGDVEGQQPADISWRDLAVRAVLIEEEKVRTLSDSTAQLTFRDASRLRLNANSNAVIQQMRYDPLTKHENAKVSLVEGDFYALLSGKSERKNFAVDIPGAKAQVQSGDFWVQSSGAGAKFVNYDAEPVDIATRSDKVVLGRNEGVVLATGGGAGAKHRVLEPVALISPSDDGTLYKTSVGLGWAAVEAAQGYWVEIAADQAFERMVVSKFGVAEPRFRIEGVAPGSYFWRVAALDAFGLPGERSKPWRFTVAIDDSPPFLRIDQPSDGVIERQSPILIEGETEPGATLNVNSQPAQVGADGKFVAAVAATEGDVKIELVATDRAGNVTRLSRRVRFMPDHSEQVVIDPSIPRDGAGRLLTGSASISLAGRAKPSSRIEIRGADGGSRGSAESDESGEFRLNADVAGDSEALTIAVTAPSGFRSESKIEVAVDRQAPTITLAEELPRVTASSTIEVKGQVGEPYARLVLNGRSIELADGDFDERVILEPGDNPIELAATDAVGNSDVIRLTVTLDSDPPKLIAAHANPITSDAGSFVAVDVSASDQSGLAATARCVVALGTGSVEGYLQLNPTTKSYQGTISVPRGASRSALLKSVDLEDAAGNRKVFRLN